MAANNSKTVEDRNATRSTAMVRARNPSARAAKPATTRAPAPSSLISTSADNRSTRRSLTEAISPNCRALASCAVMPISAIKTKMIGPVISKTTATAQDCHSARAKISKGAELARAMAGP